MKQFKLKDYVISILIISVTLLYFTDRYFIPKGLESIKFLGIEIGSFGFLDINSFISFIKTKVLIIIFASIWFITTNHWWKSSILILITIELIKLIVSFSPSIERIDVVDYLISLPVTIPFILLLLIVSHKINSFNLNKELRTEIDLEIDNVFFQIQEIKNKELKDLKKSFEKAKKNRKNLNPGEFLKELIQLRDKFYKS